jgi:hypothetical protein
MLFHHRAPSFLSGLASSNATLSSLSPFLSFISHRIGHHVASPIFIAVFPSEDRAPVCVLPACVSVPGVSGTQQALTEYLLCEWTQEGVSDRWRAHLVWGLLSPPGPLWRSALVVYGSALALTRCWQLRDCGQEPVKPNSMEEPGPLAGGLAAGVRGLASGSFPIEPGTSYLAAWHQLHSLHHCSARPSPPCRDTGSHFSCGHSMGGFAGFHSSNLVAAGSAHRRTDGCLQQVALNPLHSQRPVHTSFNPEVCGNSSCPMACSFFHSINAVKGTCHHCP